MGNTPFQKILSLKYTQNNSFEVDFTIEENTSLLLVIFHEWLYLVSPTLN